MCAGITLPLIVNVVMCKRVHMGTLKMGDKDQKWGQISQTTFMTALLLALIVPMFGKGIVDFLTFATSALLGITIMRLSKKTKGGWLAIFVPMGIAETIAETPVMGSSYYLSCITGNILNIKLPSVLNAQKIANVKSGSEEADAVAGIAVAVSSLVTMGMLALGALLLTPLKPVLSSDVVSTAASYVLPALFGCMILSTFARNVGGGVVIYGRMKAAILPFVIALVLFFVIMPDSYESWEGVIAAAFIPVVYFSSKYLYKKGKITVDMPQEETGEVDG